MKKRRRINWKRVSIALGCIATGVGIWVQLGLPTFKKDVPKKPAVTITHSYDKGMDSPIQSVLIPTGNETFEVRTPTGNSKMIEIGN